MTSLGIKDDLLDAQALRALGAAPYGGADAGEVLTTASAVRGTDLDSWYASWASLASHMVTMAQRERAAGRLVSARSAFFRAATYERTAGLMLLGAPLDPRLSSSIERQTDSFRRGAALLELPPDVVEIPYEGTTLPGYFFRCTEDDAPRPTVVLVGGYDGTVEELYFLNGAAALERGYHVLAFDGPGQGSALVRQGLHMRADWEAVMTPVVDHVLTRPEVDSDRLVLIGLSLGAIWRLVRRVASTGSRPASPTAGRSTCTRQRSTGSRSLFVGGWRTRRVAADVCSRAHSITWQASPRRGGLCAGVNWSTVWTRRSPICRRCATTASSTTPATSDARSTSATRRAMPSAPPRPNWPRQRHRPPSWCASLRPKALATTAKRAPGLSTTRGCSLGSTRCWERSDARRLAELFDGCAVNVVGGGQEGSEAFGFITQLAEPASAMWVAGRRHELAG